MIDQSGGGGMTNAETIRAAREAASLVGVTTVTWQRWEGQSERKTEIPFAYWELFLLKTGKHPTHLMIERGTNENSTGHNNENN